MTARDKYNVGIIGAGQIAEFSHIPAYKKHSEVQVISIADLDRDRCRRVAQEYSIQNTYESGESLIETSDVDIISICTPPNSHEPVFTKAAQSGCHIYCEKPFALDYDSATRMAQVASDNSVITQVGYTKRYANNYQKVSKLINEFLFGEVQEVTFYCLVYPPESEWRYDPEIAGGGIVTENLPHWLDYYLSLFQQNPAIERSRLRCINTDQVEDFAEITMAFGPTNVNIVAKWVEPGVTYSSIKKNILVGEYGEVEFEEELLKGNIRGNGLYFKHGEPPTVEIGPLFQTWFGISENVFEKPITDFIGHVVDGDPDTAAPASWGAQITKVREEIYQKGGML